MDMSAIKFIRTLRKETQKDVANVLGLTRSAYTNIEIGRREPDINVIRAIAEHFHVSTDYILNGVASSFLEKLYEAIRCFGFDLREASKRSGISEARLNELLKGRMPTDNERHLLGLCFDSQQGFSSPEDFFSEDSFFSSREYLNSASDPTTGFCMRLKQLREKESISQKKLGEILNMSQQAIAKWETGAASPDPVMLIKIADYFGVSIDYLVGRTDNPNITNDVIVESADGNITSLDDAGLSPDDLSRITAVIEDVVKKYRSAPDEVHEDEPSVLAAHADGITEEEMQEDIKKMKDYMRRKNDRV